MSDPTSDKPSVTVEDLNSIIKALAEKEDEAEKQKAVLTEINKEVARLEQRVVQHLKDLKQDDFLSPLGKVSVVPKWRVNMPASDLAKADLFQHLRDRELFDKYATVNSNSLNALYMRDWEAAKERGEGMEFCMPGIEAPKLYESLSFKRAK